MSEDVFVEIKEDRVHSHWEKTKKSFDLHELVRQLLDQDDVGEGYGFIRLNEVSIDIVTNRRAGMANWGSGYTVLGLKLKTDDENYKARIRKVMFKDGKINKSEFLRKYSELKDFKKEVKQRIEEKQSAEHDMARKRTTILKDVGIKYNEYGNIADHNIDFSMKSFEECSVEIKNIDAAFAKTILKMAKEYRDAQTKKD